MEETVNVEVLQIQTEQSQNSLKDLRQHIKDLKSELLGLEQGTQAYNDKLLELGDAQHKMTELNEQMRRTTTDFGDRVGNVTKSIAGMSGAISAVTGTLSILGIQIGDDAKLMKILVSAMSITQGISAVDAGIKAFKALKVSIIQATAAQKGFNIAALKNPYLIAGTAIVAAVVAITKALSQQRKEEEQRHREWVKNMETELDLLEQKRRLQTSNLDESRQMEMELIAYQQKINSMTTEQIADEKKNLAESKKLQADKLKQKQRERDEEYTQLKWMEQRYKESERMETAEQERRKKDYEDQKSRYETTQQQYDAMQWANDLLIAKEEMLRGVRGKTVKTTKEVYTWYEKMLNAIELAAAAGEDEQTVLQRKIQLENQHLLTLQKGTEAYDSQLIKIAQLQARYNQMMTERKQAAIENKKRTQDSMSELQALRDEYQKMQLQNGQAQTEPKTFRDINEQRDAEIAFETSITEMHQMQLDARHTADIEYYDSLLALETEGSAKYTELMTSKNIAEQTYQNDSLKAAQELEDRKTAIQKDAQQKRQMLSQKYFNVLGNISQSLGELFTAIQQGAEDNYELQKGMLVASAIVSTLAASVEALYTVWSDSSLELWGKIAATVAVVSSVIATGMSIVTRMKTIKPSSTSTATPNITAVQSLSSPINNVRETQTHTEEGYVGEGDNRVVLVYSDLETFGKQKVVVENNTTF